MAKSIVSTVIMYVITVVCGCVNLFYIVLEEYYVTLPTLPTLVVSAVFIVLSVVYFIRVDDLRLSVLMVSLWGLIFLDGIANLVYLLSDVYSEINLVLDLFSQPFIGMMYFTNSANVGGLYIFSFLSMVVSLAVLVIPLVRLKKMHSNRLDNLEI